MVFEPGQLEYLVDLYGADHVLLGTDYPYDMGDDDPLALLGARRAKTGADRPHRRWKRRTTVGADMTEN